MRRREILVAVMGAIITLAGCASEVPAPVARPAPAEPPRPQAPPDLCGAAQAQALIGRPRTEIPVPVHPALQRVACATCAVTMDYNPRRLTFLFDPATGRVTEVKCG